MQLLVFFLLLVCVRAQQNSCSCSCCRGVSCNPTLLPTVYVSYCTLEKCIEQCRSTYSQCQVSYPSGIIIAQCSSTSVPQFSCRCDCCNTGSASCVPTNVGNSLAYLCQTGACSISCSNQYPTVCVANQNGQTQGTCIAAITSTTTRTTTVTATIGPWLGNTCACTCCSTGSYCSPTYVGVTSASQCLPEACTQACRNRFPSTCSASSLIGQTLGTCISDYSGNTRCRCNCCGTNGCINYDVSTNGGCTLCDSTCRFRSPCINTYAVTQTCSFSNGKALPSWMISIFLISILFY